MSDKSSPDERGRLYGELRRAKLRVEAACTLDVLSIQIGDLDEQRRSRVLLQRARIGLKAALEDVDREEG